MQSGTYIQLKYIFNLLVVWVLPFLWVVLALRPAEDPAERTVTAVETFHEAAKAYRKAYKSAPPDLVTLKATVAANGQKLPLYDGWGNPLEYVRFSPKRWLVRSFGEDETQNTIHGTSDHSRISFSQKSEPGLLYNFSSVPKMDIFPAILLVGSDSPQRSHFARIYLDSHNGTKMLTVRDRSDASRMMVAKHDSIEEFFWLPDGRRIIYTVSGSKKYSDGVFLWNLFNGKTTNLTETLLQKTHFTPRSQRQKYWISLAGINVNGPTVYIYFAERVEGYPLDPQFFFNKKNLVAIRLPEKDGTPAVVDPTLLAGFDSPPFLKKLDLHQHVDWSGATGFQKRWLQLSLEGDIETVLVKWQEFSQKYAKSPLFPYCLWYLSSIYAQSYDIMREKNSTSADVLRSYGAEIAAALTQYPHAPTYLKSLGIYTHERLLAGQGLPYAFSDVEVLSNMVGQPQPTPDQNANKSDQ